jgi:hypothetical protein
MAERAAPAVVMHRPAQMPSQRVRSATKGVTATATRRVTAASHAHRISASTWVVRPLLAAPRGSRAPVAQRVLAARVRVAAVPTAVLGTAVPEAPISASPIRRSAMTTSRDAASGSSVYPLPVHRTTSARESASAMPIARVVAARCSRTARRASVHPLNIAPARAFPRTDRARPPRARAAPERDASMTTRRPRRPRAPACVTAMVIACRGAALGCQTVAGASAQIRVIAPVPASLRGRVPAGSGRRVARARIAPRTHRTRSAFRSVQRTPTA